MILFVIINVILLVLFVTSALSGHFGYRPNSLLTRAERLKGIDDHLAKLEKAQRHRGPYGGRLSPQQLERLLADQRHSLMRDCDRATIKNQQFIRRFEEMKSPSRIAREAYERLRLDP